MGYRVGIDVGGTFTDVICVTPDGAVVLDKTPTTVDDQSTGVMNGLTQLAERFSMPLGDLCSNLDILVHGTTTADNTMIEMNGAPTGLLVTDGHRDEIEMRRVHKEEIWDPSYPAPPPIARRRARIPIPERLDFEGNVVLPLDEDAVRNGVRRLAQLGVQSIAIMFLFSFVNPEHERRAAEIVREELPDIEHVSLSHEVMARGPEFERVSTTLVNAYVAPKIAAYVTQLQEKLRAAGYGGPLLIMQSTGGVMPPEYVAKRAVSLLGSGPTGGVMGSALAAEKVGIHDFVAVDMGGTSFDVCVIRNGVPEIKDKVVSFELSDDPDCGEHCKACVGEVREYEPDLLVTYRSEAIIRSDQGIQGIENASEQAFRVWHTHQGIESIGAPQIQDQETDGCCRIARAAHRAGREIEQRPWA
jgi:N-methylhydantoinase A